MEEIITTWKMDSEGRPAMVTGVAAYWTTRGGNRAIDHWLTPLGEEHVGVAEVGPSCHRTNCNRLHRCESRDRSRR